jgi:RNA polymerase sigma factor for flagellar operon FliA
MTEKTADEKIITQYARTRDPKLREEAILGFIPLVHYVLGRLGFKPNNIMDHDDLVSQGVIGLIEAVDHYDLSYGTKFSTYAVPRIRGKILDFLRTRDWLPRTARKQVKDVQGAIEALRHRNQRAPADEEIARYLDLPVDEVHQALTYASQVIVSLDSFIPWLEEEGETYEEYISAEDDQDPSLLYQEKALRVWLDSAIRRLDRRDQVILSLYYYDELTLREIGEVLGISESRVCQLHARAVMDLKTLFKEEQMAYDRTAESEGKREVIKHG